MAAADHKEQAAVSAAANGKGSAVVVAAAYEEQAAVSATADGKENAVVAAAAHEEQAAVSAAIKQKIFKEQTSEKEQRRRKKELKMENVQAEGTRRHICWKGVHVDSKSETT